MHDKTDDCQQPAGLTDTDLARIARIQGAVLGAREMLRVLVSPTVGADIANAYVLDVQGMLTQVIHGQAPLSDLERMLVVMSGSNSTPAAALGRRMLLILRGEADLA